MDILEIAANYGAPCLLALVIFLMYRKDRKDHEQQMREDRKFMEDRLTKLLEDDQKTRADHTTALTELITYLKLKNGNPKK